MNHPNRSWRAHLAHEAGALGPDLVSAWITLNTARGEPLTVAAADLSRDTGRNYDSNQLCKWRRGAEPVPAPAARVMRRDLLQYLLGDEPGEALSAVLEPPDRRKLPARAEPE